jgi:hypothetical protein
MGPISVVMGATDAETIEKVAAITARYSDAPRDEAVDVESVGGGVSVLRVSSMSDEELESLRI